jgi:hypothetical protein
VFRDQLQFHFAAEHAAMWPQVRAIRGGHSVRHAAATVPWALAGVSPGRRHPGTASAASTHPPPYQRLWLPRHTRNTPPL